jgi:hypothetical protein
MTAGVKAICQLREFFFGVPLSGVHVGSLKLKITGTSVVWSAETNERGAHLGDAV